MNLDPSFTLAAYSSAGLFTAIAVLGLLVRLFRGGKLLGLKAIFSGSALALLVVVGTFSFSHFRLHIDGDNLQIVVAQALFFGGIVAGALVAHLVGRIGFLEDLSIAAVVLWLPALGSRFLEALFSFGTAAAYFVTVLMAAYLILLLGLILGGAAGFLLFGEGKPSFSFAYENWIGRRFLMAKRSSHAVSLITIISVFAVMVGCAGMVVVMSVMNGFSSDLRSKILGANAHFLVYKYGKDFEDYPKVMAQTTKVANIVGQSPMIVNEVMISSDVNLTGAVIKGIDVATVDSVASLRQNMIDGSLDALAAPEKIRVPQKKRGKSERRALDAAIAEASADDGEAKGGPVLPGILVGKEMAYNLKVFVGDVVNVVSPVGELGPTGPIPKGRSFRVAGLFFSGMYEYDSKFAYIALSEAQSFFAMNHSVTGIEYKVRDLDKTETTARTVQRMLGGYPYHTKDWMQMNRNLFSALKLEKIAMFIILTVAIFMASLLILVALIMVVIEKGKEIAILKSMGATDVSIMKVFVTYGMVIGGVGAGLGVLSGLFVCLLIQTFGIGLDAEVYYITHLPVRVDVIEVSFVAFAALVVSFLATIPPALFAARLRPVEGLRQ